MLEAKYGVGADVWSVTSYSELYRDGHACERWNMLHPGETPRVPYVHAVPEGRTRRARRGVRLREGAARLDRPWLPRPLAALGTDGFGRSENRAGLREFFEVDPRFVVVATLAALARDGKIDAAASSRAGASRRPATDINPDEGRIPRPGSS